MARVISELKPHWVLGENVAGFIGLGLDKTIFDLERAGYAVQTFVYPACGVGAWHERTRTFIIAHDVSDTPCLRYQHSTRRCENGCVSIKQRNIPKTQPERQSLEPSSIGGSVLSDADSLGRTSLDLQAGGNVKGQEQIQLGSTDNKKGNADKRNGGTQSRLGGMADGLSAGLDGHKLWKREPSGVSRITEITDGRAARLKALGNAVCPPQIYPILKCIADIETGACFENCVFGGYDNG